MTVPTTLYSFLTCEAFQGVKTALFLTHKKAIAVHEVGPSHVYRIEGVAAFLLHRLAGGATGLQQLLPLAARRQHGAAQHADLRVALAEQGLGHAQKQVLCAGLCFFPRPVADDVGKRGLSVGHVLAVGE